MKEPIISAREYLEKEFPTFTEILEQDGLFEDVVDVMDCFLDQFIDILP